MNGIDCYPPFQRKTTTTGMPGKREIMKRTAMLAVIAIASALYGCNGAPSTDAATPADASTPNVEVAHAASSSAPSCTPVSAYMTRVQQAFDVYHDAKLSLIQDIKLARFMSLPPDASNYEKWDAADKTAAQREADFTILARLQGAYQDVLACHAAAEATELQPYLFALTNLEIADNLLFQARGELLTKCNSSVAVYAPYLRASDHAVAMARKDISGTIKAEFPSDYVAEMPDELANMREIRKVCNR